MFIAGFSAEGYRFLRWRCPAAGLEAGIRTEDNGYKYYANSLVVAMIETHGREIQGLLRWDVLVQRRETEEQSSWDKGEEISGYQFTNRNIALLIENIVKRSLCCLYCAFGKNAVQNLAPFFVLSSPWHVGSYVSLTEINGKAGRSLPAAVWITSFHP